MRQGGVEINRSVYAVAAKENVFIMVLVEFGRANRRRWGGDVMVHGVNLETLCCVLYFFRDLFPAKFDLRGKDKLGIIIFQRPQ